MTAVAEATIGHRVEAGAAWLDEHRPGWWQRTDVDMLAMHSRCRCVLGQEFGDYYMVPLMLDESVTLGFDCKHIDGEPAKTEFDALTEAWRTLIETRRAEAS